MSVAYSALEKRFTRMSAISGAISMLGWDHATMMPEGGAEARAKQLSTLSVLKHEIMTASDMADLLARAGEDAGDLDAWQSANLREMHHGWTHASAVPADLVEQLSLAASKCEMAWRRARAECSARRGRNPRGNRQTGWAPPQKVRPEPGRPAGHLQILSFGGRSEESW